MNQQYQQNLRLEAIKRLNEINDIDALMQSRQICEKLLKFVNEKKYTHIACFVPLKKTNIKEIDLTDCIEQLIATGVKCYKPHIDKHVDQMYFVPMESHDPISFINIIEKLDCVICPGLVFNEKGHRIGRGKGYYDKTLAYCKTINKKFVTIGVAFDNQNLQSTEWKLNDYDVCMDYVIFPNTNKTI